MCSLLLKSKHWKETAKFYWGVHPFESQMACDKTMLSHSQEGLLYGALIDYAGVNVSSLIKHQILIKILCCGYIVRFKQAISFFQSMERAVKNQLASSYLYHATPHRIPLCLPLITSAVEIVSLLCCLCCSCVKCMSCLTSLTAVHPDSV